jgi:hypothetical protein
MNKRIKLLAQEAGMGFSKHNPLCTEDTLYIQALRPTGGPNCLSTDARDHQAQILKLADLIVKECIDQVLTGPNGPAYYAVEAAMRVKKHFGVEE